MAFDNIKLDKGLYSTTKGFTNLKGLMLIKGSSKDLILRLAAKILIAFQNSFAARIRRRFSPNISAER